jgi:hypothetical protein
MTNNEWELFFIAYASVLSTISILWNIWEAVRKNRGKLRIYYDLRIQLSFDNLGTKLDGNIPTLSYTITNVGNCPLHIKHPAFEFFKNGKQNKKKEANSFNFVNLWNQESFPKLLARGETYNQTINLSEFLGQLKNEIDLNNKFRIVVQDTFGKRHKSAKSKVESLLKHIETVTALK